MNDNENKYLYEWYEHQEKKAWVPNRNPQQPMMSAWAIAKFAGILLALAGIAYWIL